MSLLGSRNSFGFAHTRIVESEMVGEPYEDWSAVRSHGRAARRRRRGFQQRIVTRYRAVGKVVHDQLRGIVYLHPDDRRRLEKVIATSFP